VTFDLSQPSQLIAALTPDIVVMVGAMFLLMWACWGPATEDRQRSVGIAAIGVCVIAAATVILFMVNGYTATSGPIAVDNFRWVSDLVFLIATIGAIALSIEYNSREQLVTAESHVLLLFATSGTMVLAAARDLTVLFLGVELMSIAVYILTGINRRSEKSAEGAIKYFLLGAFSTAFLLYGLALTYGATGSTNLEVMGARIQELNLATSPMLLTGIALMLIGFGFKVAAAPFHMWAPDVYDGAPTPITAYMAATVKAAAFAGLIRVWFEAFGPAFAKWHAAVWWLAALTMVVGNFIALTQKNIKRMLAYSSIAHAGYILAVLTSGQDLGSAAFLFYIVAYTLATFGAFGVVAALSSAGERNINIEDYAGLWSVRPWLAVAMSVFMLAMLGFPIFGGAGFFAKWYVIQAVLEAPSPQIRIAVLLVLTSVVSAGYYLYVVKVMFMQPRTEQAAPLLPTGVMTRWVIGVSAVLLLVLGLFPNALVNVTRKSQAKILSPYSAFQPQATPNAP
jgi:NADH-quinone oxidoreductase subunit N